MKNLLTTMMLCLFVQATHSQCTGDVPTINIDLSANPDTTWIMYEVNAPTRIGQCCGAPTSQGCIQFVITLHPDAAGIFFDYDGAGAFGTLNWKLNCGTGHNLKDTICISDPGPFTLTFCKAGSDNGNYSLISIPKPTFPEDQFLPRNCLQPVEILGVNASNVTWQSISPGTPGQYDSNLSCTNCLTPTFTPFTNSPNEIEYRVCGYPILKTCVGNFLFCDTVKFTIQDSLKISISPQQPSFCSGGSALLTAQASGGDGNYNYIWYNSSLQVVGTGPTYSATTTGNYTCEVRDGNFEEGNCDGFLTSVTVIETQPPIVNAGADQVLCATSPFASISGTYQNANSIEWSGGTGTFQEGVNSVTNIYIPTQNEILAGFVTLTLSTTGVSGGCVNTSDDVQIFFIDTIKTNLTDLILLCKNGNVTVNPIITGGFAPFTYMWSNGTVTSTNTMGEGSFCLTITDANNCQSTNCINITSPATIDIITSSTPASIDGGSDGTASASASGGISPYTYLWSNGETTSSISNLSYGVYTVVITDANGCERNGSVVVNEPRCNGYFVSTTSSNTSCFDGTNGSASAIVNGGVSPFSYQWNDPLNQTSSSISNLSAGIYTIQVVDGTGCIAINTATVNEPDPLSSTIMHTNVSVLGGNDGEAQVNGFGGLGGYSYLWSNGSTNSQISNLTTSWYSVTISDANSCSIIDSVFVNQPPCSNFYVTLNSNSPLCYGLASGSANLNTINGQAPFSINWSTGETNVNSISGLTAGLYTVEVTDSKGCQVIQPYGIAEPSPLSLGLNPTPITCYGKNNGTIDATINGGTYPYYYFNWSNGATSEDLINLMPGNYSLTVEDENGCSTSASATLIEPAILSATSSHQNVTCFDFSDAWIDVSVNGGTTPYTYQWSNGATSQDLNGIDVGGYILNIMDANYCILNNSLVVTIAQPDELTVSTQFVSNYNGFGVSCFGMQNGEIGTQISGGTMPYSISWSNGATTDTISDLPVGDYELVVTDQNGCVAGDFYQIDQPDSISTSMQLTNVSCNGGNDGSIDVTVNGGILPYSFLWSNGATSEDLVNISEGNFSLVITDDNGCEYNLQPMVVHPTSMEISLQSIPVSCYNLNDGAVNVNCSGGTIPYSYNWKHGATGSNLSGLAEGTYEVTITDGNNCWEIVTVQVNQPEPMEISEFITNPSCNGDANGAIDLEISGGTKPYNFVWSISSSSEDISDLLAGSYSLTVTDDNNCSQSQEFILIEPNTLVSDLNSPVYFHQHNISLFGGSDGSIQTSVTGGTLPYSYDWSNNASTSDLENMTAGVYYLIISDANGCKILDSIELTQPDDLELPTLFTPNQDGENDVFDIHGIDAYPNNELIVLNRWGNVVFEEKSYKNTWTGTHKNGEELPDGVYFVLLKIDNDQIEKNAYVHIKRH